MNPQDRRNAGAIVRTNRQAQGLTLVQLGHRAGFSASQVSRYERGVALLTDVAVLRRFATALALPPQTFGLLPETSPASSRHQAPTSSRTVTHDAGAPMVVREPNWEEGDDPVRRRELLTGAAGLAAAGALGLQGTARAAQVPNPSAALEDLLYGHSLDGAAPTSLTALRNTVERARGLFQAARYDQLSAQLPRLIAATTATRNHTDGDDRQAAEALLADAYIVASGLMVKANDDQLAWATADRAAQAATASGDLLTLADAQRSVATVMRRTGRPDRARALLIDAADQVAPTRTATADQLSMYGNLLQVAAYTAAVDGDRAQAGELISAAQAAAMRLGRDGNYRHTAFGPTNVALYQVSIAQVLGDNGTAIAHAKSINPATLPTAERQGRYWIDVARAWHQWGKTEHCYQALRSAERAAPAEVRYRPPVRRMTEDLIHANRRRALPGLQEFASRVGALA